MSSSIGEQELSMHEHVQYYSAVADNWAAGMGTNLLVITYYTWTTDGLVTLAKYIYLNKKCSWKKCHGKFCKKKNPAPTVLCRNRVYRIVEKFWTTDSVVDKNKMQKLTFALDEAWLTLSRNVSSQCNRWWCYKSPVQFIKFLYLTTKSEYIVQWVHTKS